MILLVATVLPLWVSYLVRVYSWRLILNPDGALNWLFTGVGLPGQNILYTNWAMWLVYSYIWFPFMILPVYAALERFPGSYLEASADLGAKGLDDASPRACCPSRSRASQRARSSLSP